jgi:LysR family cys regulon transcriptional activator
MAVKDAVDLAICAEAVDKHPGLTSIPSHRWNRFLIALPGHPALEARPVTLETLCAFPLITDVLGFTGRGHLSNAFAREGLRPHVVLSATDTDVIKTYVREGMGVGIIADVAYQADRDSDLGHRDLSHLFPAEITKIVYPKEKYLRRFQQKFIDLFQIAAATIIPAGNPGDRKGSRRASGIPPRRDRSESS